MRSGVPHLLGARYYCDMKQNLRIVLCTLVALAYLACGGEEVKWPEKPTDGTPVVIEFVKLVGEGDKKEAKMRIFNFEEKSVTRLQMTLDYLDKDGNKLKDFPWSAHAMGGLVGSKAHKVKEMGAFIPDGTVKVVANLAEVEFRDGTTWKQK